MALARGPDGRNDHDEGMQRVCVCARARMCVHVCVRDGTVSGTTGDPCHGN